MEDRIWVISVMWRQRRWNQRRRECQGRWEAPSWHPSPCTVQRTDKWMISWSEWWNKNLDLDFILQVYQKSQLSTLRADTIRGGRLSTAGFYFVFIVLLLLMRSRRWEAGVIGLRSVEWPNQVTDGGEQGMGKKVAMMSDDERIPVNPRRNHVLDDIGLAWRSG